MSVIQYTQNFDPYAGQSVSTVTSLPFFTGDARAVWFSVTTSSTTASRWTVLGNDSNGLTSAIDATAWQPIVTLTAQGYGSFITIPRWAQFQRTPSASSTTIYVSVAVGP